MCKFIGLFHYHHQDLFVCKAKEVGKGNDNLYDCLPDSLCDCEFEGIPCDFSEESSDGFVVSESLDKGENVVLQADDSRVSDEFCEVTSLTLAQSKQLLGLFMDDFLRPSSAVNPVCLKEVYAGVGRYQSSPWTTLAASYKEEADGNITEAYISGDIPAFELATVLHLLSVFEMSDERRSSHVLLPEPVLGNAFLSNLQCTEIMAVKVAGMDETDKFLTGEPTVGKDILETDAFLDGTLYHLYGERYLVSVILLDALCRRFILATLLDETPFKFFLGHAVVALLPLLSDNGKIEEHLAEAIRYTKQESLKTKDVLVFQMRVDTADVLHTFARLGKIGVINHQAGNLALVVRTHLYLVPQLKSEIVHQLTPVGADITQEIIEHVLPTAKQAA